MTVSLTDDARSFITERHLATLSTLSADGSLHAVPVGFTFVDGVVRVITSGSSQKVRNVLARGRATVSQLDGARWITFVGTGRIASDPESVQRAVALYAERYRQPRVNPERVAILIEVERVLGSSGMRTDEPGGVARGR